MNKKTLTATILVPLPMLVGLMFVISVILFALLGIPYWVLYLCMPVGTFFILLRAYKDYVYITKETSDWRQEAEHYGSMAAVSVPAYLLIAGAVLA